MRRSLAVLAHIGLFVGFGACEYLLASSCAARTDADVATTCLGESRASRQIVYLHGLDSRTPSWQELDNRRSLAAIPDARIAVPRAPACGAGRCWSDADDGATQTIGAIREAARTCFGERARYGVIGFSRGGFALTRLHCKAIGARWAIVAAAFGYTPDMRLEDCPTAIVIGEGDRYHHAGAIEYTRRRRDAGLATTEIVFGGGHRLDAAALLEAVDALERVASDR